jgi:hypothetical protein
MWQHVCLFVVCVLRGVQSDSITLHATQHTHHNLTHMLPQCCANYNDVILLIVSTKKVTLARLNTGSLMMVCTDRNMYK